MIGQGVIVINGGTFDIVWIRLRHARLEFEASRIDIIDPFTISPGDPYEIIASDGTFVGHGLLHLPDGPMTAVGEIDHPTFMSLILPIGFVNKELS